MEEQKRGEAFRSGEQITWQQAEILRAVESSIAGSAPRFLSVSSGHGIGKSATLSWLILWFLFCHKYAQVACTAPTAQQMYDVLAKEVGKWIAKLPRPIGALFEATQGYVRIVEAPHLWFCRFATAKKEAPEALAGVHGEHVMLLVDEASAVPEAIFEVAQGALTNKNIFFVMVSNPTRLSGFFFESHHHRGVGKRWQTLSFSSRESPLVEEDYVRRMVERYGEGSPQVLVRVDGEFPSSEEDQFIAYDLFDQAAGRDLARNPLSPRVLGIDCARFGDDATVLAERQGNVAAIVKERRGQDTMATCGDAVEAVKQAQRENNPYDFLCVDVIGIGSGIVDRLREMQRNGEFPAKTAIVSVNVAERPLNDEEYGNRRAELWGECREWLKLGSLPVDFRGDLCSSKYSFDSRGRILMEKKEDLKARGLSSPDLADALVLTFAVKTPMRKAISADGDFPLLSRSSSSTLPRWARAVGIR